MPHYQTTEPALQVLADTEEGSVWYDHKQGMVAVQQGNVIQYMDAAEWRSFAAMVARANAEDLPGHRAPMTGVIVPLPMRGGR